DVHYPNNDLVYHFHHTHDDFIYNVDNFHYPNDDLSEEYGCPCTGNTTRSQNCAKVVNGSIICAPQPAYSDPPSDTGSCCPSGGVWSAWSSWVGCQGTCGDCGTSTRNRTCLSQSNGCACTGSTTDSMSCQVVGVWSSWTVASACNSTCGACGIMVYNRTCQTADCACVGDTTRTEPCALTPCTYPNQSCCDGSSAAVYNGMILCAQPPAYVDPNQPTACQDCCPQGGVWSDWSQVNECSDTCGSCAQVQFTRTCLSEDAGCACS
ncbi:hypothetical protein FO519_010209, partial [Halicephalobus sp. NKZ332]